VKPSHEISSNKPIVPSRGASSSPQTIPYPTPLIQGVFLRRYKRFFADILLKDESNKKNGATVVAHCPNTGSMKTCIGENIPALISFHNDPKRKLKYTLECLKPSGSWVCVNTHLPNRLVEHWIKNACIPELPYLPDSHNLRREVKYGENSKIDLLLENAQSPSTTPSHHPKIYIEIKNVTLKLDHSTAAFPDSVTTRGLKHTNELIKIAKKGRHRAVLFFLVNRSDVKRFRPAFEIDPNYAKALKEAQKSGVEILVYQTKITKKGISLSGKLPVIENRQ